MNTGYSQDCVSGGTGWGEYVVFTPAGRERLGTQRHRSPAFSAGDQCRYGNGGQRAGRNLELNVGGLIEQHPAVDAVVGEGAMTTAATAPGPVHPVPGGGVPRLRVAVQPTSGSGTGARSRQRQSATAYATRSVGSGGPACGGIAGSELLRGT